MPFLLVCLISLSISVQASPASSPVVEGLVRLADGSPVADAQVVLFDVGDLSRGPVGQATTDEAGTFALPPAARGALMLPQEVALGPNYPNPFNPSTIIPYQLASPSRVRLEVFNVLGQRVATLVDEEQAAGSYRARWDGTDAAGSAAAAGVYIYRLTVADAHWTSKMVLLDGQAGRPLGGPSVEVVSRVGGSSPSYGLVVSGVGLVPYVDTDFGVAVEPVTIELAAPTRMKVAVPTLEGVLGDVDNDGQVDLDDGLLVAMYGVNPALLLPHHGLMTLGDVNCDGRVDLADAALLAIYVAHPSDPAVSLLRIGQRGGYSLDPVTEMVWGSILGTDKQDATVARILHDVPVLISGVMPIDGQDRLYLGIDQTWWDEHGGKQLYAALQERFPVTPLHVEPSIGVVRPPTVRPARPAGKPMSPAQEEEPAHIFLDTFEDGLDGWQTTQWEAHTLDSEATVPGAGTGNIVAQAKGCSFCFMTLTEPVDLSEYETVTLSFYRWMDAGMGDNEFLGIDIGNNGSYRRLDNWDQPHADGQWHLETYTLTGDQISDAFTMRFFAIAQNALTTVAVDNVTITATPTPATDTEEPEPTEEPDESQEPEEVPTEGPDLTITLFIVSPESVSSGGQLTFFVRTTNNGTALAPEGTIRIYRHTKETETPTHGGTAEQTTATVPAIGPNSARIRTIQNVTAPTVLETTTYYYYACADPVENELSTDNNCSETPLEVIVRPTVTNTDDEIETEEPVEVEGPEEEVEEPTEDTEEVEEAHPNLTISSLTITPTSITSGERASVTLSVTNSGGAVARSETVSLYRHQNRTATPEQGGTIAGRVRTGVITPEETKQWSVPVNVPASTSQTTYHYYACIDSTCAENPATISVRPKSGPVINTPPLSLTVMGGDNMGAYYVERDVYHGRGSITLGGIETVDGTRGFIGSAHVVADNEDDLINPSLLETNLVVIDHNYKDPETGNIELFFLGRTFKMPRIRQQEERNVIVDAAFVAYPNPHRTSCSLMWTSLGEAFCLDHTHDNYIERVSPLTVRGEDNKVYTVTGSQEPTEGLEVRHYGSTTKGVSGTIRSGRRILTRLTKKVTKYDVYSFDYYAENKGKRSEGGDSGAPVYTNPDTNGNVNIVGILGGTFNFEDSKGFTFNSWSDVTKEFDLKPIE